MHSYTRRQLDHRETVFRIFTHGGKVGDEVLHVFRYLPLTGGVASACGVGAAAMRQGRHYYEFPLLQWFLDNGAPICLECLQVLRDGGIDARLVIRGSENL